MDRVSGHPLLKVETKKADKNEEGKKLSTMDQMFVSPPKIHMFRPYGSMALGGRGLWDLIGIR